MKTKIPYPFKNINFNRTAFLIHGKSMEPMLSHGDMVFVNRDFESLHGKMIAFKTSNEKITARRFFQRDDRRIELRAENSFFPTMVINPKKETLEILGVIESTLKGV
jgi:phage repressor protein C with HTH and peptisase S24 domain